MTDVEKRRDRSPVPSGWTYAPAPESTDIVELRDRCWRLLREPVAA